MRTTKLTLAPVTRTMCECMATVLLPAHFVCEWYTLESVVVHTHTHTHTRARARAPTHTHTHLSHTHTHTHTHTHLSHTGSRVAAQIQRYRVAPLLVKTGRMLSLRWSRARTPMASANSRSHSETAVATGKSALYHPRLQTAMWTLLLFALLSLSFHLCCANEAHLLPTRATHAGHFSCLARFIHLLHVCLDAQCLHSHM
jgi:hypothetical protein